MKDEVKIKYNMFLIDPLIPEFKLTGDEVLGEDLTLSDKLMYLTYSWKYDLLQ